MHQNASRFRLIDMDIVKPPQGLRQHILLGIAKDEGQRAKNYFLIAVSLLPVSLFGAVVSSRYLMRGFYESGFYQYLSLLFSGDSSVLTYWKELAYSLVETMPFISITAFLIAFGFLIWSGANTFTNVRRFVLLPN